MRGELTRAEINAILQHVPPQLKREEHCERMLASRGSKFCLALEQQLVDAVKRHTRYKIETAPPELRIFWKQLATQKRKLPVKALEGGGLALATKLNATGKASLLKAIKQAGKVQAIDAAFDYPGAQQHVLEFLNAKVVAVVGAQLVSVLDK